MSELKSSMRVIVLSFIVFSSLTGCYSMPKEGEYSTIPTTNNPDVVGSHGGHMLMPTNAF